MSGASTGPVRARRALGAALAVAALALGLVAAPVPAPAQETAVRGPVTGLPLPRYVSLKASRANMRRGPGRDHRVDWVLVRRGLPLRVVAEYDLWRRVRDMEGAEGWVYHALLSGARTAVTLPDIAELRQAPSPDAPVSARAEAGVILQVEACRADWCEVARDGARGWAPKSVLWGVAPAEVFD
jgi:SH3-like domain-containing protein